MINNNLKAWSYLFVSMIIKVMKRWSKESWNDDHDVFTGYPQMQYLIMIFTMIILCIGDVIYTRIDDQEPIYLSFWRPYWWDITHLIKIHSSRSYLEVNPSLCLFTGSMIMRAWFIIATWAIFIVPASITSISAQSPILSALNRKSEKKTHASERF